MVLGVVRFHPALKHMTDMTDTRTPLQKELQTKLFTLTDWEDINSFVAKEFPVAAVGRTLTALHATPMDADYVDWQGVVDYCILRYL